MTCNICGSLELEKIHTFKPYQDKSWTFELYDCLICETRFALRDNTVSYHEEIHASKDSSYQTHYLMAENVKMLLNSNLPKCQKLLTRKSQAIQDLFKYIDKQKKEINILEIGCSTGYVTAFLQQKGYTNTLGIDISKTAIDYAKAKFGDFYALQADNKKYDVIFHIGLIGCVDNPKEFLHFYLNYLQDDGVMFFNAPNVQSIHETKELWVSTPPPDLIYLFKKDGLAQMIGKLYHVQIQEVTTPANILVKYINKFKNKTNNIYPRNFIQPQRKASSSRIPIFIKSTLFFIIEILVSFKIIMRFSDEYGLIVKITKKVNS